MLAGLDEIDWSAYWGAYGPCTEAPDILRAMADQDPQTADEGRVEFYSSIWHQGTVYPVTVVAVPFLVELATTPGVRDRDMLLVTLGELTDPEQSNGDDQPAVREAIAARSSTLVPQLADPDPEIRAAAAYTVARCGPQHLRTLHGRWAVESDSAVRAVLLLGIAHHEGAACAELLCTAATTEAHPLPAAAALAYAKAGLPLPAEAVVPVAASFSAKEWRSPWAGGDPLRETLSRLDGVSAEALAGTMLADGGSSTGRVRLAKALQSRFRAKRSAPAALMPYLRELLADRTETVVAAAVDAAVHAGPAAAAVADELARIAGDGLAAVPQPHGDPFSKRTTGGLAAYPEPANTALSVLVRLGDRRWRDPALAAWEAGLALRRRTARRVRAGVRSGRPGRGAPPDQQAARRTGARKPDHRRGDVGRGLGSGCCPGGARTHRRPAGRDRRRPAGPGRDRGRHTRGRRGPATGR
ncbi:hypothetical protein ACFQZ4_06580 [Catellatospora coxensis]